MWKHKLVSIGAKNWASPKQLLLDHYIIYRIFGSGTPVPGERAGRFFIRLPWNFDNGRVSRDRWCATTATAVPVAPQLLYLPLHYVYFCTLTHINIDINIYK